VASLWRCANAAIAAGTCWIVLIQGKNMKNIKRLNQLLLLLVLIIYLMVALKEFMIPMVYGLLIALIIYPICRKLEQKKVPTSTAIFLSISIVVVLASGLIGLLALQIQTLKEEMPALVDRLYGLYIEAREWVTLHLGITNAEQNSMITNMKNNFSNNAGKIISSSFSFASLTLFHLVIIPLYASLILFYRRALVIFIASVLPEKYKTSIPAILKETIQVYFNYIKGMLLVYLTVGVLNSIGLLLLGVNNAILYGTIAAFMTIIPYIGIIISSILPIAVVWAETNNFLYPLGVVAVFSIVQYLEANFIFPYIVGKQLGLNTLVSIVAILLGGVIWGVSGMILFLPFVALLKIISSHIEELSAFKALLEIPEGKKSA
jgi:predicted PurR-regulated permease PerM